jgi:F-box associated protein
MSLDPASTLPKGPFLEILCYFDPIELAKLGAVSKTWKVLTSDDQVWKRFCSTIPSVPKEGFKKFLTERAVVSLKQVMKLQLDACEKMPIWDQFVCFFPLNPKCSIKIKIQDPEKQESAGSIRPNFFLKKLASQQDNITWNSLMNCYSLIEINLPMGVDDSEIDREKIKTAISNRMSNNHAKNKFCFNALIGVAITVLGVYLGYMQFSK